MKRASTRAESVSELAGQRQAEVERAPGTSLPQRRDGPEAGDADLREAGEALEPPHGRLQAWAECSVERP